MPHIFIFVLNDIFNHIYIKKYFVYKMYKIVYNLINMSNKVDRYVNLW